MTKAKEIIPFYKTPLGEMIHGDALEVLRAREANTVDLIMTSPPFGLLRPKAYGNVPADAYGDWFNPFAKEFFRVLKDTGSLVIDMGGAWKKGQPTRSLYHFKALVMLCEEIGFHLAQEVYWWNPSRTPVPTEWVSIRRIRLRDAVNTIWWLSKTPWPKASNQRALQPCSAGLSTNPRARRPREAGQNNGAAIAPNLIALANTGIHKPYVQYCRTRNLPVHPARFPSELPEYFIRMLTDPGDMVVDPFGGSCTTGEVCQRLGRYWQCIDLSKAYLEGAIGRFEGNTGASPKAAGSHARGKGFPFYRIPRPGAFWDQRQADPLPQDGGRNGHISEGPDGVLEMNKEEREKREGAKKENRKPEKVGQANKPPNKPEGKPVRGNLSCTPPGGRSP